jgi:hypothetical protein
MNGFAVPPRVRKLFPFLKWWPRVNRHTARADLVSGITGALIVLPQGVAFATIAGMPPEYGLYAAMIPAVIAALFGSSWHLVSGPTTAISIAVFASVVPYAQPGSPDFISLVLTLTFLVGVFELVLGAATVVDYSPGYESGHAPFLTPRQVREALAKQFSHKLGHLIERIGGSGIESFVAAGQVRTNAWCRRCRSGAPRRNRFRKTRTTESRCAHP